MQIFSQGTYAITVFKKPRISRENLIQRTCIKEKYSHYTTKTPTRLQFTIYTQHQDG